MKIVRLEAENVKRIKAVRIEPDGSVVVIGGRNAQGKSSVLDAIWMALGGKEAVPTEPIRRGQKKAHIRLDLGELVVERTFTTKDSYLKVTAADGSTTKSPQILLDSLVGRLAFDPLAFSRMAPKSQADELKALVGLDFQTLDAQRATAYEERRLMGRDLAQAEAQLNAAPHHPDAPDIEVSLAGLGQDLKDAETHNNKVVSARAEAQRSEDEISTVVADLERIRGEIAVLQTKEKMTVYFLAKKKKKQQAVPEPPESVDTTPIVSQMQKAESVNAKVRANAQRQKLENSVQNLRAGCATFTKTIEGVDEAKAKAMAAARFPVDGLGFDETGVTLNGLPFAQTSDSEKLRTSVAMGLAMNPKLRVILIRDGSLLDRDSKEAIRTMAEAADAQVWEEVVTTDHGEATVIIEDGEIAVATTKGDDDGNVLPL